MQGSLRIALIVLVSFCGFGAEDTPAPATPEAPSGKADSSKFSAEEFQRLKTLAESGNNVAQVTVGTMYAQGKGVPRNYAEAMKWFRRAADGDNVEAQLNLGILYESGHLGQPDYTNALKWYRAAAVRNQPEAQMRLAALYSEGLGIAKDLNEAAKWNRMAADSGNTTAQVKIGFAHLHGHGVPQDFGKAHKWFAKAAKTGDPTAQFNIGTMHENGQGVPSDIGEARKWYRAAAEKGLTPAQVKIGHTYYYATPDPNYTDAALWYRKAAEKGDAIAQLHLAMLYDQGKGVPEDKKQAFEWYRKAAQQGHPQAQAHLAFLYLEGRGHVTNEVEAANWFRKAADQGDALSQFNLGLLYETGRGVKQDFAMAVDWYGKAAAQKHAWSQLKLGTFYDTGTAVTNDVAVAAQWYRKAAKQGLPEAEYALAICHAEGAGVEKNLEEAHKWAESAASHGLPEAAILRDHLREKISTKPTVEWRTDYTEEEKTNILINAGWDPKEYWYDPTTKNVYRRKPQNQMLAIKHALSSARGVGTGFFISEDGYFLTCFHVIDKGERVLLGVRDDLIPAQFVKGDRHNDIAVLKVRGAFSALRLTRSGTVRLGASIFTIGFPNSQLQGISPKLTRGEVSSLDGLGDDPRHFQISAPVQPGNSGSPLIDLNGNVIGMIIMRLSDVPTLALTGTLPQNVNYAVKSSFMLALLETVPGLTAKDSAEKRASAGKFEDLVAESEKACALVLVY